MAAAQENPGVYGWAWLCLAFDKLPYGAMNTGTIIEEDDMWQLGIEKINSTSASIHLKLIKAATGWRDKTRTVLISCFPASQDSGLLGGTVQHVAVFYGSGDEHISTWHFQTKVVKELYWEFTFTHGLEAKPGMAILSVTDVLKWFKSKEFGDTTIVAADGMKFRCHRGFLAQKNEVFARRVSSCERAMKEARENLAVINIRGFNWEIVAAMLLFFYTNECGEIGPIADRLYAAAHLYQLDRIKNLCETALTANLSTDSIVKTYRLAKLYDIDELMAKCDEFLEWHKAELSAEVLAELTKVKEGNEDQMDQQ